MAIKQTRRTDMDEIPSGPMAGRTVLGTGGTGGIGRATAVGLATMGARLAITGRDLERAKDAAREIRAAGGGKVDVFVADMSSQSEVRRLADEVLQSLPRIDVLVNNVGGYWNTRHVTADGLERTFALNHLASFLLTNLLLDRLTRSAPGRRHLLLPAPTSGSHANPRGRRQPPDRLRRPPRRPDQKHARGAVIRGARPPPVNPRPWPPPGRLVP